MKLHSPAAGATAGEPRLVYAKPDVLADRSTHYCPGCGHGIIHRLLAEVMTELDLPAHTIAVAPVGCSVFAYDYLMVDWVEAPHGRAPAVATGIRRVRPEAFVLTYQGDGDLAAIGTAEIVGAAARGERITAIFVNNGIYGMTGGQMAPTTLIGQRTTSSPTGRDALTMGFPIRITEMLAQLPGVTYAARGTIADASQIGKLKSMIRRACQVQIEGGGFAIVEALSNCPVGWGMTPQQSLEHLKGPVVKEYPLGVIVDRWTPRDRRPDVEHSVVFAGFGGQGLLFTGQVLARAAIKDGLEVFWIPSYGPEMRGGTASCTVIIGDEPIGSPVVDQFDAAVVMNLPSLRKFGAMVARRGLLLMNTSLLGDERPGRTDVDELRLPCTELAAQGGDDKLVSIAALGALVARTGWVTPESVHAALREMVGKKRPEIVDVDLSVFAAGMAAGQPAKVA